MNQLIGICDLEFFFLSFALRANLVLGTDFMCSSSATKINMSIFFKWIFFVLVLSACIFGSPNRRLMCSMKYTWKYTMHQYTFNQLNLIKINLKSRILCWWLMNISFWIRSPLSDSDDKAEYGIWNGSNNKNNKNRTNELANKHFVFISNCIFACVKTENNILRKHVMFAFSWSLVYSLSFEIHRHTHTHYHHPMFDKQLWKRNEIREKKYTERGKVKKKSQE